MIKKLDTNITWYLSHPCTSCGTIEENYIAVADAEKLKKSTPRNEARRLSIIRMLCR